MGDERLDFPSARRNAEPISQVLQTHFPKPCTVLEIASGSGQHAVHFTAALAHAHWWPSDLDPAHIASINAWRGASADGQRLHPAQRLDVCSREWQAGEVPVHGPALFDALLNVNMIHIAPWAATKGLMTGAAKRLHPGGKMVLYGPFMQADRHTAASNTAFDADLRRRNPDWGLRDMGEVTAEARKNALARRAVIPMPANNFCLVFERVC